jgi:hypothetical protein
MEAFSTVLSWLKDGSRLGERDGGGPFRLGNAESTLHTVGKNDTVGSFTVAAPRAA